MNMRMQLCVCDVYFFLKHSALTPPSYIYIHIYIYIYIYACRYGYTPLLYAAEMGRLAVVACLCEHGADTEACDDSGFTALHRAARWGKEDVVQYLVEQGAHCDAINDYGRYVCVCVCAHTYISLSPSLLY